MSLQVLVIPEYQTYNGYILQPVVKRMLSELGKPNARVNVLPDPKLNGYPHAVSAIRGDLIRRYKHVDLWLFLPDGDRAGDLRWLESEPWCCMKLSRHHARNHCMQGIKCSSRGLFYISL